MEHGIETLIGKSMKIFDTIVRRKMNFMCLFKTKWTGEKMKGLGNLENRMRIIVDKERKKDICFLQMI